MTTGAIITMVAVQVLVTVITAFLFIKILRYKPKEDDSYTEEG